MNTIVIKGSAGKDAEVKMSAAGKPFANFSVASNYKGKDGQESVSWFNCTAFGYTAEGCSKIKKGDKLMVEGRMQEETYNDKTTGQPKKTWKVIANDVAVNVIARGPSGGVSPHAVTKDSAPIESEEPFNIPF